MPYGLVAGSLVFVGVRYSRAVERRQTSNSELNELRGRVTQLEELAGSLSADLDRVRESQDFMSQLLLGKGVSDTAVSRKHVAADRRG